MLRRAYSLVEVLMSIAFLCMAVAFTIPVYRQYLIRNDLEIARQNVVLGLERAQLLAQMSADDSGWGLSTDAVPGRVVVFKGDTYATRDTAFDELYSISPNVSIDGMTEVSFGRGTGIPDREGSILMATLTGGPESVTVVMDDVVDVKQDLLAICLDPYGSSPQTMYVTEAMWVEYSDREAILGECGSFGDVGGTAGGGGGSVTLTKNGKSIEPDSAYTCEITVLGSELRDAGAYNMPITLQVREAGTWQEPFGNFNSPVTASINRGNVFSGSCTNSSIAGGTTFHMQARSWMKKRNWYDGTSNDHWRAFLTGSSIAGTSRVEVLVDGDAVPAYAAFDDLSYVKEYLRPYVDIDTGTMTMNSDQALYLFELGEQTVTGASDMQDIAVLVTFTAGS